MRLPDWIKTDTFSNLHDTKQLLRKYGVSTVCEEARCPNKGHCFSKPTATFMILGDNCTRDCGFCSVSHSQPSPLEMDEPERVALAAKSMGLRHVVITSVTRDDLVDGGAPHFAKTVVAVRRSLPETTIEVLTPDFKGNLDALIIALSAMPDVFNHNVETVPRLYSMVRPQADYSVSLKILEEASDFSSKIKVKSGMMVGLGETFQEVVAVLKDLRNAGCDFITIGQYLRPSKKNFPVVEYIKPEVFSEYKEIAHQIGFEYIASAPLVRSSMNAEEMMIHPTSQPPLSKGD